MMPVVLAEVWRGEWVESLHHGWAVLLDGDGRVLEALGDPVEVFARSSIKALQAVPLISTGAADRFGFTVEELAMACSSHSATERHVTLVRSMLSKAGVDSSLLHCGAHPPLHEPSAERMREAGERPTSLHNNCSGKHSGMLTVCKAQGWDLETYYQIDHPLQQMIKETIARLGRVDASSIQAGVDGCGVPAWRLPLAAIAVALGRMVVDPDLRRLPLAMGAHPELVAGEGRFDTQLMEAVQGRLVCKGGAEALHVGVEPATGRAWAVKVADGNRRAIAPVVLALLSRHGMIRSAERSALADLISPVIKNHAQMTVGRIRAI